MNHLQTVLDALEQWTDETTSVDLGSLDAKINEAIATIKAMMQAEPVAFMTEDGRVAMRVTVEECMHKAARESYCIPLFAAPQAVPAGFLLAPVEPTEAMWSGLARDIVFWLYMNSGPHYGSKMYEHLRNLGTEIPDWLLKEIPDTDSTPPKGTVAVVIYKATLAEAPKGAV